MTDHEIIQTFYSAFKSGDAATMASLYHDDAEFRDPAFGKLNSSEVKMMWKMLMERSQGNLKIDFTIVEVTGSTALVKWEARYPFTQTK